MLRSLTPHFTKPKELKHPTRAKSGWYCGAIGAILRPRPARGGAVAPEFSGLEPALLFERIVDCLR